MEFKLNNDWSIALKDEFNKGYLKSLVEFLNYRELQGDIIYPTKELIFNAFNLTPLENIKVVILGQDPYHGAGQAHGLAFSVPDNITTPPSLKNIYKEISTDLATPIYKNGNLESWAKQGVFLLNTVLTVKASSPTSHSKIGWQQFTDSVIKLISNQLDGVVFMLWGNYAKSKAPLIESSKHLILEAAHPSPLARGAFFGCKHFSKCNNYLQRIGKTPINWDK